MSAKRILYYPGPPEGFFIIEVRQEDSLLLRSATALSALSALSAVSALSALSALSARSALSEVRQADSLLLRSAKLNLYY